MTAYVIRRLLWIIPVLFVITLITFGLMHTVRGGPFEPGSSKSTEATRVALAAKYHLDQPVYNQYFYYMEHLVQGDLGPDLVSQGTSVNDILGKSWKPTAVLGLLATVYVIVVGITLGVIAAMNRNTILDYLSVGFATVGASAPNFVLGIMLVVLFAVQLGWLPAIGWSKGWTDWKPVILPTIVLGSLPAAYVARLTRASMIEVMNQDYVRTARAKGLRERVVITRHILRNALIPVLTLVGPIVATLVTGSFIVEQFFAIPGIGRAYVQAIVGRDYPVIMATTLLYAFVISIANLGVDLAYAVIDPRIRYT
ncbi:MAG TPA: ABC transporter permease [Dehalococcoidia bacterium]